MEQIDSFLDTVFAALSHDGIDVSRYEMDHICYRVETQEQYDHWKQRFDQRGELLIESIIGGRPIATYKFDSPIVYKDREIYCVELPAPKNGSAYSEGWEHVEFVIDESFDEFMARHPHITFKTKAMSKTYNPDISIKYTGFSVKFHLDTLENVIAHEKG